MHDAVWRRDDRAVGPAAADVWAERKPDYEGAGGSWGAYRKLPESQTSCMARAVQAATPLLDREDGSAVAGVVQTPCFHAAGVRLWLQGGSADLLGLRVSRLRAPRVLCVGWNGLRTARTFPGCGLRRSANRARATVRWGVLGCCFGGGRRLCWEASVEHAQHSG